MRQTQHGSSSLRLPSASALVRAVMLMLLGFLVGRSANNTETGASTGWSTSLPGIRRVPHQGGAYASSEDPQIREADSRFRQMCCAGRRGSSGYWDVPSGKWVPSWQTLISEHLATESMPPRTNFCAVQQMVPKHERPSCLSLRPERVRDVNKVISCLTRYRRVVFVGDSVHRGLFWSLEQMMRRVGAVSNPRLNVTIHKNFVAQPNTFTNFQDQDMIVSSLSSGEELFSVRFIYGSNAVDWPDRCMTIGKWFFQCLKSTSEILAQIVQEEQVRFDQKRNRKIGGKEETRRSSSTKRGGRDNRRKKKVRGREDEHKEERPIGLLYWNTGLWDWRTGRSPQEYKDGLSELLAKAIAKGGAFNTDFVERVVWRSTGASWPSKFITGAECDNKPHSMDDTRPCSVHTDGILQYNAIARRLVEKTGMDTVDSWPITNGRPDLTFDGLHFEHRDNDAFLPNENDVSQVYRTLNDIFLNTVCSAS